MLGLGIEFFTGAAATIGVEYLVAAAVMFFRNNSTATLANNALAEIKAAGGPIMVKMANIESTVQKDVVNAASSVVTKIETDVKSAEGKIGLGTSAAAMTVTTGISENVQPVASPTVVQRIEADVSSVVTKVENAVSSVEAEVSQKEKDFVAWFKNRGNTASANTPLPT